MRSTAFHRPCVRLSTHQHSSGSISNVAGALHGGASSAMRHDTEGAHWTRIRSGDLHGYPACVPPWHRGSQYYMRPLTALHTIGRVHL